MKNPSSSSQGLIGEVLWSPNPETANKSNIKNFLKRLTSDFGLSFPDYASLHTWSVTNPGDFWSSIWSFTGIIASTPFRQVFDTGSTMSDTKWFPGASLNFAQNLLRHSDNKVAVVFWGEDQVRRQLTYQELYQQTASFASSLRKIGVQSGDRVVAFAPNIPETLIAMLATSSIGAIWSSCSPDFGTAGVVDRFGQIEPKVLLCADGYFFKGDAIDSLARAGEIVNQIPSIEQVIVAPYTSPRPDIKGFRNAILFDDFQDKKKAPFIFEQLPADHPLYIMFSSGTTGKPKCMIHRAGGILIEHLKEHQLNSDLKRSDKFFYQTTCGWMMWNWLVTGLASGATIMLYDGAPFYHDGKILFEMIEREGITIFGTNAKYIAEVEKRGLTPAKSHNLSTLRAILSTGSPLAPESFDFVYTDIKSDIQLSSITGGTDIVGLFGDGCPILPVRRGEIQCKSLGLNVQVFNEQGQSIVGEKGELVCTAPFPSMPLGFWNDPDGARYHAAYFERFPGVWAHGDYVELTSHGGLVMYGRSDAVLNPGGIRIGTAEIYRQVEQLPEILERVVIGQMWESDVRVILFVKLAINAELTDELKKAICSKIRKNTTAFHVPKKIIQVLDIPRTRSGKIVELAVRNMVEGLPVKNIEALSNPEALEYFHNIAELAID